MARTIRDATLDSRTARERLTARGKPYYRAIEPGLHLGYRKAKGRRGQRVAGAWVCRLYIGDQNYRVERIGTADDFSDADGEAVLNFRQAQNKAREKLTAMAHPATGPMTVRAAVEEYLTYLDREKRSGADARYRAEAFIYPDLGDIALGDLTAKRIRDWLTTVAKAPGRLRTRPGDDQKHRDPAEGEEAVRRRRSTSNRTLTVLKAALNRQWREGHVSTDEAWRRVEPFENVEAARIRYLTVAEAQRLINAADPDFRALIQAGLHTGARYGELANLEIGDFNPDSETLAIRTSKSGRPRHVELSDEGVAFFREVCAGRARTEVMFRKPDGGSWGKSHQSRPMAIACKRARISPAISFHVLRHTWASLSVMNGVPLIVVAKNLGHLSRDGQPHTRMVERHYGHLAPSYVRDAIRAGAPRFNSPAAAIVTLGPR